ncbi:hypothetical protein GCM10017600_60170 [Streptosporangium carneum]|uniref:AMP-dependent synthetase/ligase domain-containing protein n=1 Tax=Streptosporangium carneum TaxID=47481 RepID=A0A9W6I6J4_9ACTN|nr:hypothetical protein GCM10017600_60170 [Streptosporangium carneum]
MHGAIYGRFRTLGTFAEIVRSRADDEHIGLRFGDESWTWAQVVQESADRAAALRRFGKPDGRPHIGVLLENVPDYVFWIGAAALSGAVVVGINPTRRGEEMAHDIRHTDCDLIITEDRLAGLLEGLDHGVPADAVLNVDSAAYRSLVEEHRGAGLPDRLPPAEAILLLLFSSGSTGAPKAVICSQGRLGFLAETLAVRTELTRDSVSYLCMPLFHGNSAMMNLAPATLTGATVCLARKFSASGFVRDVHRYGATFVTTSAGPCPTCWRSRRTSGTATAACGSPSAPRRRRPTSRGSPPASAAGSRRGTGSVRASCGSTGPRTARPTPWACPWRAWTSA